MPVVLNVKGSLQTTVTGHNREVVGWPLKQVPLYVQASCLGQGQSSEKPVQVVTECTVRPK